MTPTGRRVRSAAAAVVFGLLLAGNLWGEDHHFPFGPFRMYATSGRPNGAVRTPSLIGVHDGRTFRINPQSFGLRRAELEGQVNRFKDPDLMAQLAEAYGKPLDELRLVTVIRRIRDSRSVGESTYEVEAVWRPDR